VTIMMIIKTGAKPTPPPARPGLLFEKDLHRYRMNTHHNSSDYKRVTGVTTLISATLAKPALVDYQVHAVARAVRENMPEVLAMHADVATQKMHPFAFDKAVVQLSEKRRDRAAARGTAVHDAAEKVADGHEVTVPKELHKPVNHYADWLDDWDVEVLLKERPCGNRTEWYAGTFDLIARFHAGPHAGKTWLVDLKTSNQVYGETALQAVAYAMCEFYVDENKQDQDMPAIDGIGVLHLNKDGAFFHDLGDMEAAAEEFEAILLLHQSRARRESLIKKETP